MKKSIALILSVVVSVTHASHGDTFPTSYNVHCNAVTDVTKEYQASINDFIITVYRLGSALNKCHVVFSPTAIWITLAAIAEGVDPKTQQELFHLLKLPNDPCVRQQFYKIAISRLNLSDDIHISNSRILAIDEGVTVNPDWYNFVSKHNLINVIKAPIKKNPEITLNVMRKVISAKLPNINLSGNSVLLDAMDFSGLWTTAFSDAIVERAPFYDIKRQKVGSVDLMRMRKYARMGYSPNLQAKVLEVPLGVDGRYSLLYGIILADNVCDIIQSLDGSIIKEVWDCLRDSAIPIDIAVPKYTMTSEIDVRIMLEELGVKSLWNNSEVTRFISEPATKPSSYVHRTTVTFDTTGVNPAPEICAAPADASTGLDPRVGREFIADKPFVFGLYDKQTHTCVIASVFVNPTYPL